MALAGWLSWLEHHLVNQKVLGLNLGQGTYLGFGFNPWEATDFSLSLSPPRPHPNFSKHNLG